jgi:uncharacterized protein
MDIDFDRYAPRTRHELTLAVPDAPIAVPVIVIAGSRPRPRLAVVGGVHGDEYDGIQAAQRLARTVDPKTIDGTLVIVPIANPNAYAAGQRISAIDGIDLNRVFPGHAQGRPTERLADCLCRSVLRHMDLIFTLHGAGAVTQLAWYLEFFDSDDAVGRASYEAAVAAGFENLVAFPPTKGFLLPSLGALGVPVIEGEVGGRGELHDDNATYYLARIEAVMRHLSLQQGKADGAARPRIWRTQDVQAPVAGILRRDVALNAPVQAGQLLGQILDKDGGAVADLAAPVAGVLGGFRAHAWIQPGELALRLFVQQQR